MDKDFIKEVEEIITKAVDSVAVHTPFKVTAVYSAYTKDGGRVFKLALELKSDA